MPLITCEDCGQQISDRASACPNCGAPVGEPAPPPAQPGVQKVAVVDPSFQGGKELGEGCVKLAMSGPMAFILFIVAWVFGSLVLAQRLGWFVRDEPMPLWVAFVVLVLPFILAWVLRRQIRAVVPLITGSGCIIAVVLFFIAAILIFISMAHSFFFDWSGAK